VTLKQIICELDACVHHLEIYNEEKRYSDMLYLCGRLTGYSELLRDMAERKYREMEYGAESDGESKLTRERG